MHSGAVLPLSSAQQEMWLAEQASGDRMCFTTGVYHLIRGDLDTVAFDRAVRQVIAETDCLHVRFEQDGAVPRQVPIAVPQWRVPIVDVSAEPSPLDAAVEWMEADIARPRDRLFSHALFRLGDDTWAWYHGYHHIAVDAAGLALIATRVAERYHGEGSAPQHGLRTLLDMDADYRA
jgi:hypothetical protein